MKTASLNYNKLLLNSGSEQPEIKSFDEVVQPGVYIIEGENLTSFLEIKESTLPFEDGVTMSAVLLVVNLNRTNLQRDLLVGQTITIINAVSNKTQTYMRTRGALGGALLWSEWKEVLALSDVGDAKSVEELNLVTTQLLSMINDNTADISTLTTLEKVFVDNLNDLKIIREAYVKAEPFDLSKCYFSIRSTGKDQQVALHDSNRSPVAIANYWTNTDFMERGIVKLSPINGSGVEAYVLVDFTKVSSSVASYINVRGNKLFNLEYAPAIAAHLNTTAIAAEQARAEQAEDDLLDKAQGRVNIDEANQYPIVRLENFTDLSGIEDKLNSIIENNASIVDVALGFYGGVYRAYAGTRVYEVVLSVDVVRGVCTNIIRGALGVENGSLVEGTAYTVAERTFSNSTKAWSEWRVVASGDNVEQTKENATAIAAEQSRAQEAEQSLYEQAVEQGKSLALRSLFATIGALYNDTDEDIERIAPWKTEEVYTVNDDGTYTYTEVDAIVKHNPKCYYMNGIGDITEAQMIKIFSEREAAYQLDSDRRLQSLGLRTIYIKNGWPGQTYANYPVKGFSMFNSVIEVFFHGALVSKYSETVRPLEISSKSFQKCSKLAILSGLKITNTAAATNAFDECTALREVFISGLQQSINLSASANITRRSVLHLIINSVAAEAITIQLHSDVYARLENDAEVLAALAEKPLVTLITT